MNRSFCWMVLIIALCILSVFAPASAAPGGSAGQSYAGYQGSSGPMASESPGQVMGSETSGDTLKTSSTAPGNGGAGTVFGQVSEGSFPVQDSAMRYALHGTADPSAGSAGETGSPVQGTASSGPHGSAGNSPGSQGLQGSVPFPGAGYQAGTRGEDPHGPRAGSGAGQNGPTLLVSPMTSAAGSAGAASGRESPPWGKQGGPSSPYRKHHESLPPSGRYPCGPAQASSLPIGPGQAQNPSGEEPAPRTRSRRFDPLLPETETGQHDAPAPGSLPVSFLPASLLLFGGYRRVSRKNVLSHDARSTLYREVLRKPGSDGGTLARATGINENTLRYHLVKLVETGTITTFVRPGVVRYFPNQGRYSPFEQVVIHYTRTATPCSILELLSISPGMTRQDLADALALSGPSVSRQMFSLIDDGILENRSDGRSNHYFLTRDAYRALKSLADGEPAILQHPALPGGAYTCHRKDTAREAIAVQAPGLPRIPGI